MTNRQRRQIRQSGVTLDEAMDAVRTKVEERIIAARQSTSIAEFTVDEFGQVAVWWIPYVPPKPDKIRIA